MNHLSRPLWAIVIASVALVLAGCGGSKESVEATTTATAAPAKSSVPFDRAFIDGMVPHHRSAIEMAVAAEKAGLSQPDLIGVATSIVDTQQAEIDKMLAWRKEWYGSATIDPKGAAALGMTESEMGMGHNTGDLSTAADVDGAFATMMIDHHEGAIAMAELALARATHPELKKLAREIIRTQTEELATMKPHASGMSEGGGHAGMTQDG